MDLNVVCLKWGDLYSPKYVNVLYAMVKRNLTVPHKFICVTENTTGLNKEIEVLPLQQELNSNIRKFKGWWYKLFLFKPDNGLSGRVFYLDLDTAVVGNIDKIAGTASDFITLRDFYVAYRDPKKVTDAVGSGLMAWTAGNHAQLWNEFIKNPEEVMRVHPSGDQMWIQKNQKERKYWQDLFPNQIVSFKAHIAGRTNKDRWYKNTSLPKNTRIVCFHGPPRPHEVANSHGWMHQHWTEK